MSTKKQIFLFLLFCSAHFVNAQDPYTDSLKQRLTSLPEDTAKVNLLNQLSDAYVWSSPDTGKIYAEKGLQLAQKLNHKYGEGLCLGNLCIGLSETGDFINALKVGYKAVAIFESIRDTSQVIDCYIRLLICYRDQGDYRQALVQGYKAKEMRELLPFDSVGFQLIFGNLGSVYEKSGQLDSALYYAQKAYELDKWSSSVMLTLGNIYSKMGNQERALDYYRISASQQSGWTLMDIYEGMSKSFEMGGNIDSSIYYAKQSLLVSEKINNPRGTLDASKQLASLYGQKGITDSTVKYLKSTSVLNDSLFSIQKTREAQSFAFNEQFHQQELQQTLEQSHLKYRSRLNIYFLSSGLLILLLVAAALWRRNIYKRNSISLLEKQKEEIQNTLTQLKSTQSRLIQSEKMASLGELTAGIAHEIQNPLNFVNNFSELNKELLTEMNEEIAKGNFNEVRGIAKDVIDNQEKINFHGKRADAIVKGMLQHSRTSSGQKELTDINRLADEYLRLAYHGMHARDKSFNAKIETKFDNTVGRVNIVPEDIGRAILNLIHNSFYAVNEKAKQNIAGYEPTVSVTTRKVNYKMELRVADNGNGIPEKLREKIFQPFFTTKPTGQGTGLGLSLAYDIVKAHGGEIKVESKEGEGSEFSIEIPI
jgi:two-component system, NtrC family, sensor kinase